MVTFISNAVLVALVIAAYLMLDRPLDKFVKKIINERKERERIENSVWRDQYGIYPIDNKPKK